MAVRRWSVNAAFPTQQPLRLHVKRMTQLYEFVRIELRAPALEIEGLGRAAFLLVANCDPYTYAGKVPIRVSRGASFDLGLDVVAPRSVSPGGIPRLLVELPRGAVGRPGLTVLHDMERVVVRCDEPMPLQIDGEDLGDVTEVAFEAERDAVSDLV